MIASTIVQRSRHRPPRLPSDDGNNSTIPIPRRAVAQLTPLGARLAIDDLGPGPGLVRILKLAPTVLKLDGSLVQPAKQTAT